MYLEHMISAVYKKEIRTPEATESCIIKALVYFSIFQYPLTKEEIKRYLRPDTDMGSFEEVMENLVNQHCVFKWEELYSLEHDISLAKRRLDGNLLAAKLLPKAMKIGRFLSAFPYVKGIGISGSLSKMFVDEKADIDFFIITKANRLWIARTCMHLFKKLTFLTGTQHFYCMNYYLDEDALKLEEQNIYTAVETITLLPVCGESMRHFFTVNNWVDQWFADYSLLKRTEVHQCGRSFGKRIIEWVFNNRMGNMLDTYLMRITARRWLKKKRKGMRNEDGDEMDLITGKHFARSNPGMFQEKLLALYEQKVEEMKRQWPEYF